LQGVPATYSSRQRSVSMPTLSRVSQRSVSGMAMSGWKQIGALSPAAPHMASARARRSASAHLADHLLQVAQAALGVGAVGDLLALAQLRVEEVVGVQQPAVFTGSTSAVRSGLSSMLTARGLLSSRENTVSTVEALTRAERASSMASSTLLASSSRRRAMACTGAAAVVVAGVVEDVEVQAQACAVDAQLGQHAELAEQLDLHATLGVQRQHQAVGAQAVVPVPGLQGLRRSRPRGVHGGRAFTVAGTGGQHFGAALRLASCHSGRPAVGHADHFGGQVRAPGLQRGQAVFADALCLAQAYADPREEVQVQLGGGADLLGEAFADLATTFEGCGYR
jgi:hypothetical protein